MSSCTGIVTFKLCVPGKNMLPSCVISCLASGDITVSTVDLRSMGVMLFCGGGV